MNFDFALLHAGIAHHELTYSHPGNCTPFSRFVWVKRGAGTCSFGEERHVISPGRFYFVPPLLNCSFQFTEPSTYCYLYFTDRSMRIFDHFFQYRYRLEIPITSVDEHIVEYIVGAVPRFQLHASASSQEDNPMRIMQRVKDFLQLPASLRMELSGLLHVLLSHFMHKNAPAASVSDRRISQAIWNINRDLGHVVSLEEMAAEACLNKNTFIRLFRQQTGSTPTDYVIRRRMVKAQLLFISGYRSVKEVANQLGYDNVSYFGRTFKRIVGISPQLFIRHNHA